MKKESPRLSERLRQFRDQSKKLVLEEMVIYSAVIAIDLIHDFVRHYLDLLSDCDVIHPIQFGWGQVSILMVFGALLYRKFRQWNLMR